MIEKDKKEFRLLMGEVLEQVVLPEIQGVKDDVQGVKDEIKEFREENRKEHEENQEQHTDMINSINRVETLTKSEIKYVDDLSKRVLVLEPKKS